MLGVCEKSGGVTATSVCTAWRRNTFPLSGRRRRRRRHSRRSGVLLIVRSSKWTLADRGIFHVTRHTVRRSFKATLIADIRGARRRAANEN